VKNDLILRVAAKLLMPFMLLFALYVQFHGDYGPGGGFQAGVIAATKSYARLLAKEGVTVNAISPALIGTEMVASNPHIKPDMIPVGRFGRVEECADVAVMLARNAYITGQTISVNGGMYFAA